jgi:ankyrin repeat protein
VLVGISALTALVLGVGASCTRDPNAGDNAPLYAAIGAGDVAQVRALLDAGADPNSRTVRTRFGERQRPGPSSRGAPPPLIVAVRDGEAEIVRLLLAKGARVDVADDDSFTPLEHAIEVGDASIVSALLERGANARSISKHGFPIVLAAAARDNGEIVRLLLVAGADANTRDAEGRAAAHYHGSQLGSAYDRLRGRTGLRVRPNATALMLAAQRGQLAAVNALLDGGADVNAADEAGRTALMLVAEEGVAASPEPRYMAVARRLLDGGSDVNAQDANGETALTRARTLAGLSATHAGLVRMFEGAAATR